MNTANNRCCYVQAFDDVDVIDDLFLWVHSDVTFALKTDNNCSTMFYSHRNLLLNIIQQGGSLNK